MDVAKMHAVVVTAVQPMLLPLLVRRRGALLGCHPALMTQVVALIIMGEVMGSFEALASPMVALQLLVFPSSKSDMRS